MKVISSLIVSLCAFAIAFGQDAVQLGQTQPIDLKVTNVNWHPMGKGLIYTRDLEEGVGLGVYTKGSFAGKVVLEFGKTDVYSIHWFQNQTSAIVQVQSELPSQPGSTQMRLFLVDAELQTSKQIFSDIYDKEVVPNFEIDTSPLLKHAIIKLSLNEEVKHLVLCHGATALVPSTDLDRAEKQGLSGPSWSIDGTAVYGQNDGQNAIQLSGATLTLVKEGTMNSNDENEGIRKGVIYSIALDGSSSITGALGKFRIFRPAPPTGSSVMELMPSNPILRPVRFRGPWSYVAPTKLPLSSKNQPIKLTFGNSSEQDFSVWMKRGVDPGAPATLLAVHASRVWIDNSQTGVVYLIDGALFYRPIN